MFRGSPFYDRIILFYNDPDMNAITKSIGLGSVQVKKTRSYARIVDAITDPLDLMRRLEGCDGTNMDQFIRYCLSVSPPYQSRI